MEGTGMRQCDRCGEANDDVARYCGTCGQAMSVVDAPDPVAEDGPDPDDETAPSPGPGAAGLKSSEYVSAPTFGETAAVSAPAIAANPPTTPAADVAASTTVVAPPGGPPPQQPDVTSGGSRGVAGADGRSSTSTGVMIAALAVAAVVIVGGVFILLSRGSDGTDIARTEDGSAVPPGTATETFPSGAPVTTNPAESESADPLATTPPTETTPPPVSTAPPVSAVPPVAATTLPPEPAPTAPPPIPSRGPGDLGLTQPILDEVCDGRYITFVGSAVGNRPYGVVVDELLGLYPGTNYVWTKACPSLRQEFSNGADIYGVVFGPYATQQEACNARAFGPVDAYVRRISTFDPQDHTITC